MKFKRFGLLDLFRQIDRESKVFKRRVRIDRGRTSLAPLIAGSRPTVRNSLKEEDKRDVDVLRSMFDSLVRAISPNCLLVTADYQIRRVYGNINRYISLSEGDIRGVTISMLKDSFRHEVRTLISLALRHREPRFGAERRDPDADETMRVQVQVYPLTMIDGGDDLAVVAFRESTVERAAIAHDPEKPESEQHIVELERELNTTRDSLQQTVEELETTNEELQALNEELQSGNEELQSTNEELETANEELQSTNEELHSVNEELYTVNAEYQLKIDELTQLKMHNPVTGLLMVGGGVPKNFVQDIVVAAEILCEDPPMHKYAVQITVADVRDGALSSSTLKEASSWGKVDVAWEQMVYSEATLALPPIASYLYHSDVWKNRKPRRFGKLYQQAPQPA